VLIDSESETSQTAQKLPLGTETCISYPCPHQKQLKEKTFHTVSLEPSDTTKYFSRLAKVIQTLVCMRNEICSHPGQSTSPVCNAKGTKLQHVSAEVKLLDSSMRTTKDFVKVLVSEKTMGV